MMIAATAKEHYYILHCVAELQCAFRIPASVDDHVHCSLMMGYICQDEELQDQQQSLQDERLRHEAGLFAVA